jgi:hypothetical protein
MTIKHNSNNYSRSYIIHGDIIVEFNRDYHTVLVWRDKDYESMGILSLALEGKGRLNYDHNARRVVNQTIADLVKQYR